MFSENSGIVDPFNYTIALAENAAQNGAEYFFDHEVTGISRGTSETGEDLYTVTTTHGTFESRWVINSAGLGCGKISDMLGIKGYRVIGSREITSFWIAGPESFFRCRSIRFRVIHIWESMLPIRRMEM